MSAEDLEKYETEMELQLYREYRDVVGLFSYVVETERRFYLTNDVKVDEHKGYVTPEHQAALRAHGPCPEHRFSYVNVRGALIRQTEDDDELEYAG